MWLLAPLAANALAVADVARFHGVRENPISGMGIVVGLRRTGDSTRSEAAVRSLAARLEGYGAQIPADAIVSRNSALVIVNGILPSEPRTGLALDVTVASAGDAMSLDGGYLLLTPMFGADGEVYAVAQGPVLVSGFAAMAGGEGKIVNHPTVGRIVGGALVEREIPQPVIGATVDLVLLDPDFRTAARVADAIDKAFGVETAEAMSSATVTVTVPAEFRTRFPAFAAQVSDVVLELPMPARVVVNERTGTVVAGADIAVGAVAISHGNLTIEIRKEEQVSQPGPLAAGQTAVVTQTTVNATQDETYIVLPEGSTIADLVGALDKIGVRPRDLVAILEALSAAGALRAELVVL